MEKTKNINAERKGITLIALVITVIVLLILAGITINLTIGQDGILRRTQESGIEHEKAQLKEELELAILDIRTEKLSQGQSMTREDLMGLEKIGAVMESTGIPAEGEYKDYFFEVDEEYVVTIIGKVKGPKVTNITITTDGTTQVEDQSVVVGTPLQINFEHSINGGTTTVDKTLPYTTNGTETEVTFTVTGTVNGENYTKTIVVSIASKYREPQITIGDVKITNTSGVEVADKGVVTGTPLKINFDNSIEEGTTQIKLGGKTVTLPYTTNGTDTEFKFVVVGTVYGIEYEEEVEVSIASKYRAPKIAEVVQIGDFVNYTLGRWTSQDIAKLGSLYIGTSAPSSQGTFGGFGTSSSKDGNVSADITYTGWRVLSKNSNGSVNIIHAGAPEMYYSDYRGTANSYTILRTTRDWSMYEDCSTDSVSTNYAVKGSAHCMTNSEAVNITGGKGITSNTLRAINFFYFVADPSSGEYLYRIMGNGYIGTGGGSQGIRPIVTLKAEVTATATAGHTTHTTPATAWNLGLEE